MATLYVSEYAGQGAVNRGNGSTMGQEPAAVTQAVSIAGSSTQSNAFTGNTSMIRMCADTSCFIVFGVSPSASNASGFFLPPNVPVFTE
jgi:hypothetical protein